MRGAAALFPATLALLVTALPLAQAPSPAEISAPPPAQIEPLPPDVRFPLRIVVIDPGHGGDDIGARGPGGAEEKLLTLSIAQRVKTLIETRLGSRVILTRNDDRRVGLDERAATANNSKADVFLSLHLNAAPVARGAGAEVYHMRLAREDQRTGRGAAGEVIVLPVYGGATRRVDLTPWDLAHARHAEASAALAGRLDAQLRLRVPMSPRPPQEFPLRVLASVDMPAALVEMAYLTNPEQERLVQSNEGQGHLAQALFDAVLQFLGSRGSP